MRAQLAACRASVRSRRAGPSGHSAEATRACPPARPLTLQYLYLLLSVVVLLPISLGVEGADWAANFAGWSGGDWAVLCTMSCCVVVGANLCIQHR